MSMRLPCLALTVAVLAGCVARLPDTSFGDPAALERAMKRYYEAHATEQYGYCLRPYIDGLTQVSVVANQPDRLVVDVRYLYGDRFKSDRGDNGGHECIGFAGRTFTLGKGEAGEVRVLEMTGPRRR